MTRSPYMFITWGEDGRQLAMEGVIWVQGSSHEEGPRHPAPSWACFSPPHLVIEPVLSIQGPQVIHGQHMPLISHSEAPHHGIAWHPLV